MQRLQITGRESERQPATMRDSERYVATPGDYSTVRDSQQSWKTVRDSQQLHRTGRDCERRSRRQRMVQDGHYPFKICKSIRDFFAVFMRSSSIQDCDFKPKMFQSIQDCNSYNSRCLNPFKMAICCSRRRLCIRDVLIFSVIIIMIILFPRLCAFIKMFAR